MSKPQEKKEFANVIGKIVKITPTKGSNDRLTIYTNQSFLTIDKDSQEEKETTSFGLNIYHLVNQISEMVPYVQLADALAGGNMVNPKILILALTNADVMITREYHEKGETRKESNDVYSNNCVTSVITKVVTHINPLFEAQLMKLINEQPAMVQVTTMPNIFNI